jgi:hypothetical protein
MYFYPQTADAEITMQNGLNFPAAWLQDFDRKLLRLSITVP